MVEIKFDFHSGFYCVGHKNNEECMVAFREFIAPKIREKNEYLYGLEGRDLIREKVRIRDKHTCQECGKVWEKGQRRFDVHHLDEELESREGRKYQNNNIDRMITLCHKCHLNLPHLKEKFSLVNQRTWDKVKSLSL